MPRARRRLYAWAESPSATAGFPREQSGRAATPLPSRPAGIEVEPMPAVYLCKPTEASEDGVSGLRPLP